MTPYRSSRQVLQTLWISAFVTGLYGATELSSQAAGGIELSGDILQGVLPAFALGATFWHRDEDQDRAWDRRGTLEFAESAGATLAVTYGLKYGLNTRRPNGGTHSMPSGHTSISFASAEFLRKRYGWEWGIPMYAAASWVAYSRVESLQHHPQDVIAGAGIGILSSYLFTKPYHGWQPSVTGDWHGAYFQLSRVW